MKKDKRRTSQSSGGKVRKQHWNADSVKPQQQTGPERRGRLKTTPHLRRQPPASVVNVSIWRMAKEAWVVMVLTL